MATRLLLITVQTIACSQFNISSGVTAKGKQEQIVTKKHATRHMQCLSWINKCLQNYRELKGDF